MVSGHLAARIQETVEVPPTVELMFTGACNLACPFCYGPDPSARADMPLDSWLKVMDFLMDVGVKGLVLAGGEPTVRDDFVELCSEINRRGFWQAIQSNTINSSRLAGVIPYADWICVPVDGATESAQGTLRTSNTHTETAVAWYEEHRDELSATSIKVGTVVTAANISELADIAAIVSSVSPDVWKLYELRARGEGRLTYEWLHVDSARLSLVEEFLHTLPLPFPASLSWAEESNRAYLILNPDSRILVPDGDFYLEFGRLLEEGRIRSERFASALCALKPSRHRHNLKKTFPGATPEDPQVMKIWEMFPGLSPTYLDGGRVWLDR